MNATLDPRRVEQPFLARWLRMALELFIRSPLLLGSAIALLGWVDTSAVTLAGGYEVAQVWVDRLGLILLPALWVLVAALARIADDSRRMRETLLGLVRRQVWVGVLAGALVLLVINLVVTWTLHGVPALLGVSAPSRYLTQSGQFVGSLAAGATITLIAFGPCYPPLLGLVPGIAYSHARDLARKAAKINGEFLVWCFVCVAVVTADSLSLVFPAYGMTMAACLVFLGVFNYVAYRDIFERRSENQAATAVVPAVRFDDGSRAGAEPL